MGASRKELITVSYVTDHDCGNYRIGEIDFGVSGVLRRYLELFGADGKKELTAALSYLIYKVEREYRSIDQIETWAKESEGAE